MSEKFIIKYKDDNEIKELVVDSSVLKELSLPSKIISIKKTNKNRVSSLFKTKSSLDSKAVALIFYELNMMLQANLVFIEAIDILIKNRKDRQIKYFLETLKKSFTTSSDISKELEEFKLDKTVLSFLHLSQKRGNIKSNIKALSTLLLENQKIKSDFKKAIRYPFVLIISFFFSLNMIFYFVLPNFKSIFSDNLSNLPLATKILFYVHSFYENYFLFIFLLFVFLGVIIVIQYNKAYKFKCFIEKLIVKKLYLFKDIYKSMQFYRVFLILDIMLKSNYEFHEALSSSKVLLKNQYLLDKISLIENLLKNGRTINHSFSQTNLFDDLVLNLLNSAEKSNSLPMVVSEIKEIYKNRFTEKIKLLTSVIEPIFLVSLMGLILWIVLAIFMPIWDMGKMLNI